MLQSEFSLACVTRISLSQDCVSVAGNDLPALECLPDKVFECVLGEIVAELLLDLLDEKQHLLVGQAVKGTGETVHASSKRKIRVGQRRTDQMHCMRAHISALVVTKQFLKRIQFRSISWRELGVVNVA